MSKSRFFAFVLGFALVAGQMASGAAVEPTDLGSFSPGTPVVSPATDDFIELLPSAGTDNGDLTNNVYVSQTEDGVIYTYTHKVTIAAGEVDISTFNTFFDVIDFNGVAGWSFSEAFAAGGAGDSTDFFINEDEDGTIDWTTDKTFFDGPESITFFFQSFSPPDRELGRYGLIDGFVSSAESFQPIPAPAALPAGVAMLSLWAMIRRRRGGVV